MSLTVTLHAWYLAVWLAVGAVIYWPLALVAWKNTNTRGPFFVWITNGQFAWTRRRRIWTTVRNYLTCCALWPLVAWEELR